MIQSIWIENEHTTDESGQPHNPQDTNSDIIVLMADDSRWVATAFSYQNIQTLTNRYRLTGECLAGAYFWASDMLLVNEVTREQLTIIINQLLLTGEFFRIFQKEATTSFDE